MRNFVAGAALALILSAAPMVQAAETKPAAAKPAAPKYSTADTDIGTLLDNPVTKAIIEKNIPGMTTNPQIDMARGMTLRAIQAYAAEEVTDARLAAIDAELAKVTS
ncbi:hypothetical protein [Novosphingobium sp. KACC 22771]|uniref:hypothetical protein n=1 Tax=Novosphingobium sp. KACC 22771 TaxID=3025670 RepID=UPI0023660F1F|nr:hypothetical protein [Novosphingobium sp. KACC 22771]WDF74338.1 hypothetical protein PQ467_20525 [Novosphingobium sp. KACC 22771]